MMHSKVWESQLLFDTRNVQMIDVHFPGAETKDLLRFQDRYDAVEDIPVREYPAYIHFSLRDVPKKKKDNLPDIFQGELGLVFVSGAMHDLLTQYNLGRTRFHQVPLFEHDQKTPRPGRWYFMHFLENRKTLVPEASTGLRPVGRSGRIWKSFREEGDKIALNPAAAEGLDLWLDRSLRTGVFFSDRLKCAIKDAGLNARWLGFRPCKVVRGG